VRLWLAQVNRSPGVDAVEALTRLWQASEAMDDAPGPVGEFLQLTRIRALLMEGRPDRVVSPLNRLADAALAAGRNGSLIEIFVLQALAAQAQGDMIRASAILRRALTLAEPEGYRRIFLDEGERMVGLLAWGLHRGAWRQPQLAAFAAGLLARLGGATPALTPAANGFTSADGMKAAAYQSVDPTPLPAALFEPLSDRELEVLQLVAAGATNQEVADHLMVSVNTVRTHLRSIYDKLQVGSRTHAVARARALGWLR
jgi:LuxR family maltose regulon positive regulatory protein